MLWFSLIYSQPSAAENTKMKACLYQSLFSLLEEHRGAAIDHINLVDRKLTKGRFHLNNDSSDANSIYIGVANHPKDGSHHYYLIAGNKRFDGSALFFKPRVRISNNSHYTAPFSEGIVFKITGESNSNLRDMSAQAIELFRKKRNITCLHALCKVMDHLEIEIPHSRNGLSVSGEEMAKSLMGAKVLINGKPAHVRMSTTSGKQLNHYLKELKNLDKDVKNDFKKLGGIFLFVLTIAGIDIALEVIQDN